MFTLENIPVANTQIVDRVLADEAVLVLPEVGQVKVLNQVGARIWQLIDGQASGAEIAACIHQEFEVDLQECRQDTLAFLQELQTKGMITVK
ncbi:MAG: PqqD family protein [Anaerolineales bacterium]|nr:PqqD family protein [Anaerolineales bacterium]